MVTNAKKIVFENRRSTKLLLAFRFRFNFTRGRWTFDVGTCLVDKNILGIVDEKKRIQFFSPTIYQHKMFTQNM